MLRWWCPNLILLASCFVDRGNAPKIFAAFVEAKEGHEKLIGCDEVGLFSKKTVCFA
jgi:hypothetical protein